jgi:hypothetical protein
MLICNYASIMLSNLVKRGQKKLANERRLFSQAREAVMGRKKQKSNRKLTQEV